jgi:hypothetical protein
VWGYGAQPVRRNAAEGRVLLADRDKQAGGVDRARELFDQMPAWGLAPSRPCIGRAVTTTGSGSPLWQYESGANYSLSPTAM